MTDKSEPSFLRTDLLPGQVAWTNLEQAARAVEWPVRADHFDPPLTDSQVERVQNLINSALLGLLSDENVEKAARATFEMDALPGDYTWAEMVAEDPSRADIWREDARKVLQAVLGKESS